MKIAPHIRASYRIRVIRLWTLRACRGGLHLSFRMSHPFASHAQGRRERNTSPRNPQLKAQLRRSPILYRYLMKALRKAKWPNPTVVRQFTQMSERTQEKFVFRPCQRIKPANLKSLRLIHAIHLICWICLFQTQALYHPSRTTTRAETSTVHHVQFTSALRRAPGTGLLPKMLYRLSKSIFSLTLELHVNSQVVPRLFLRRLSSHQRS